MKQRTLLKFYTQCMKITYELIYNLLNKKICSCKFPNCHLQYVVGIYAFFPIYTGQQNYHNKNFEQNFAIFRTRITPLKFILLRHFVFHSSLFSTLRKKTCKVNAVRCHICSMCSHASFILKGIIPQRVT